MNRPLALLSFLLVYMSAESQDYPKDYFGNPMNPPFVLAGTFGEIRPDHFHTGIDFSTKEVENLPVYAAGDGYVSRIKISVGGFGKAIYITHPNHYVTVYAHLNGYSKAIETYVRKKQYEKKSFEIELFPEVNEFKVKKGEQVAFSGNSGSSSGPHLHFEIRDEKTEEPINPLFFGYNIPDTIKPLIKSLRIVPAKGYGSVNNSEEPLTVMAMQSKEENLSVATDDIKVSGMVGFEVNTADFQNNSESELGIYTLELIIDNRPIFGIRYDCLNFSDLRYVNAHIDYAAKYDGLGVYERCYKLNNDKLKIYREGPLRETAYVPFGSGYFNFSKEGWHMVEIVAGDFNGNKQSLQFKVQSSKFTSPSQKENIAIQSLIVPGKDFYLKEADIKVTIPASAVYEACPFSYSKLNSSKNYYSAIYEIGDPHVPLHLPVSISIKATSLPENLYKKAVIVSIDKTKKESYEGGAWHSEESGGFVTTKSKHFGSFAVTVDTTSPVIVLQKLPDKHNGILKIRVTDNLSGIKSYKATIDGKWNLTEYDSKSNSLTYDLAVLSRKRSHKLKLTVTDAVGNITVFTKSFFY